MKPTLLIGNKNFSSWSLRPWLALKRAGIAFDEAVVILRQPDTAARIAAVSPSGKVPAYKDGALLIWDSLAICEYAAEKKRTLWPSDVRARAMARAVSCEMHSGFQALRSQCPMNLKLTGSKVEPTPALLADIDRIEHLWADCRARFGDGGPWLFGKWSIADAMYAPVATRFVSYDIHRPGVFDDYLGAVFGDPIFQEWRQAALAEEDVVAAR